MKFYLERLQFDWLQDWGLGRQSADNETLGEAFNVWSNVSKSFWVNNFDTFGTNFEYQEWIYVCSGVENEMPLFNKIVNIIVQDDIGYLLTFSTVYFDNHLNAFCIKESTDVFTRWIT